MPSVCCTVSKSLSDASTLLIAMYLIAREVDAAGAGQMSVVDAVLILVFKLPGVMTPALLSTQLTWTLTEAAVLVISWSFALVLFNRIITALSRMVFRTEYSRPLGTRCE